MTIIEFIKNLIGSIGDSATHTSKDIDEYSGSNTKLLQDDVEEMLKDKTSEITLTDDLIKIKNKDKTLKISRK
jgi:hypothetical protein